MAKTKKTSARRPSAASKSKTKRPATSATSASSAKRSTRTTPKVSPLRGMSVDTWVTQRTSGWQKDVVNRLLAIARAAAPSGTFSIKWGQPVLEGKSPIAYMRPAKDHVTFGFWRGAELDDPDGVLEGGDRMKHLKLASAAELDESQITKLVRAAVALDGIATKRGR